MKKKQGSNVNAIKSFIKNKVGANEQELYKSALAVEQDKALNEEMAVWDLTAKDGLFCD
jgi:hypothetical protein